MTNEGSTGILLITWKDVPNDCIQNIISSIYMKNQDAISGMKYYEVGAESAEMANTVSNMFEKQITKDSENRRRHEVSRKERSLEAFC